MGENLDRRNILKMGLATVICTTAGVLARPASSEANNPSDLLLRAGIITDMHKTSKADSPTRKYSASLGKMQEFIKNMSAEKPAFLIELGDFVDMLAADTDPAQNLHEIESVFTSFNGPTYHVLGNHEFDNLKRDFVLKAMTNTGIPQGQTWYSWDADGIHFIVLDADYTPGNYRPYDMNIPTDTFWTWKDTCIPPQELEWLQQDLRNTSLPVVVFTHQTLDRVDEQDHNIKNASAVRALLEENGRVLAVISGHDHSGGYSNIKGIHYIVLNGNVGVHDERTWDATSKENGFGLKVDNQFSLLEISRSREGKYVLSLGGHGRQPSYVLERTL